MIKWKLYKEETEGVNLKKLLRQNGVTKFPSGTEFRPDRVSWSKSGGYAGQKTLGKICSQLKDAGWKRGEWRTGGVPDGSAVTNSNAYTSPDGQLVMTYREHYGATAYDNFYGFTFKFIGQKMSESSIESEQELVNEIGEEKVIQTLAQLKTGVPTDHEFYKTPCMMFLNVRFVERWVELDTQEGPWSSKNCQTSCEKIGDDLILADLMVWHKNDLHMINTPARWVWIFGDNTTWDDVCEARGHFTGNEPYGFSEEAKAEIVNKLKGHAITHRCLEEIIPRNMTKRDW